MAEYLVIRLPAEAEAPAQWIAVDSAGTRRGPPVSGALSEAATRIGDRKVIVLVPGTEVLATSVDLPVKAGARLQAALPFALEESVADDIDDLHFAAGARRDSGRSPVSVVSHACMEDWLGRLRAAGIHPARMIPENHGLARIPGTISVLLEDDERLFINDGEDLELVMQSVNPGDALVAIGALDDRPLDEKLGDEDDAEPGRATHLIAWCTPAGDERYKHDWNALRHELDGVDIKILPEGSLPKLAATVATGAGTNLLVGRYGPKAEYGGLLAPWRHAAAVLLGLLLVATGAKAVNVYTLGQQEAALREQFHAEYREIAPGAPEVDDPMRVVASLRARAGGGNDSPQVLLAALEQLGQAMTGNAEARIEGISFNAGVVDVKLTAPNVSVLDDMRRSIDESGQFRARIQSTDQEGERVSSQIRIQVDEQ